MIMTILAGKRLSIVAKMTVAFLCSFSVSVLCTNSVAQTQTYSEARKQHPDWVQVPGGELVSPDCVHVIPHGATVEIGGDGMAGDVTLNGLFIAHYGPCPEQPIRTGPRAQNTKVSIPDDSGHSWIESADMDLTSILSATDNIDYIAGSWQVPLRPDDGALVFLFDGIVDSDQDWILQPVLQYGENGSLGGGDYWSIASWVAGTNGQHFTDTPVAVNVHDYIFGQTKITSTSGIYTYWSVVTTDATYPSIKSTINVRSWGLHFTLAFAAALEAYRVTSCDQLPGGNIPFSSLVEHGFPSHVQVPPNWKATIYPGYNGPKCDFSVVPWYDGSSILFVGQN
jgi:hypothetical protein